MNGIDDDVLAAAADLVGRTGAKNFEIGYLHDDVPASEAGWYATATFKGAKVIAEGVGPTEVAAALAERLLTGARCRCGRLVALSDFGAVAYDADMADGSKWTKKQALLAGQCRWKRQGARWEMACQTDVPG